MEGFVPLTEAVSALRAEIEKAIAEAKDSPVRFELGAVEMEFNAVVSREGTGGGKIQFKLLGLGAEANLGGKITDQQVQRIKLSLTPRLADAAVEDGKVLVNTKVKREALKKKDH